GACVVLIGEIKNGELNYKSLTSCLTPLANVSNKHVVTIEGVNVEGLNPIQQAMTDESATQCGFCTPGFVMSFAGFCLSRKKSCYENAIAAVDGNICRCTGYKSIERSARKITNLLDSRAALDSVEFVASRNILPTYFSEVKERLQQFNTETNGEMLYENIGGFIGGGTDLYVQKHDELKEAQNRYLLNHSSLKGIWQEGNKCLIGASVTVTDLEESPIMIDHFPDLKRYIRLVSSTPIRNIATLAGNFINASPIGDLTIFFLALNATLVISNGKNRRELPLRKLYKGYKTIDKYPDEFIERIWFELPGENTRFHFEKVSKRTYLDIATVNSAISLKLNNSLISEVHLSAGGVGPIPLFLENTCSFLKGKTITEQTIQQAIEVMQREITPISDVRGSESYKRLLLAQLFKAHFVELFGFSPAIA
ncbi:MAG: FAD binding domain-containing protein, partial [Flavitalea sp.]